MHRNPFTPRGTSCPARAVTIVTVDITNAGAKPFWNTLAESGVCTAVSSDGPFAVVHADTGLVNPFARLRTEALFMRLPCIGVRNHDGSAVGVTLSYH